MVNQAHIYTNKYDANTLGQSNKPKQTYDHVHRSRTHFFYSYVALMMELKESESFYLKHKVKETSRRR